MPNPRIIDAIEEANRSYILLKCSKCFGTWTIPGTEDYYIPPIRKNIRCPHCKEIVNASVEGW